MILLEVVDAERRKEKEASSSAHAPTQEPPAPSRPSTSSSTGLPDYATSQAQAVRRRTSIEKDVLEKPIAKSSSVSGDRKFRRIIIIALAIYFVLSIAIGIPLFFVLRRQEKQNKNSNALMRQSYGGYPPPPPGYQIPPDISSLPKITESIIECNNWSSIPSSRSEGGSPPLYTIQYKLPANESLYLHSNLSSNATPNSIPPIQGLLHVSVSSNTSQHRALVTVSASDISGQDLHNFDVCKVQTDCGWGVAIYVLDNDSSVEKAYFTIDVSLPQPSKSHHLNGLVTDLPTFNQSFESLEDFNHLSNFIVQGSAGSITADYVEADVIFVRAMGSEITGTFNTSNTLILESMLAPVGANVALYNDAQALHPPTFMQVLTGNSDVNLNVTLHSDSADPEDYPPAFQNAVRTVNGTLSASFSHDSSLQGSCLQLSAHTNYKPAQVFIDDIYQGTFDVDTMMGTADVDDREAASSVDPTGEGRNRTVEYDYTSPSRLYGWVGWGERIYEGGGGPAESHISLSTVMADGTLKLTSVPNVSEAFVYSPSSKSTLSSRSVCLQP